MARCSIVVLEREQPMIWRRSMPKSLKTFAPRRSRADIGGAERALSFMGRIIECCG
jgi:hypothetical protein